MKRGVILRREELRDFTTLESIPAIATRTERPRVVPREWLLAREEAKALLVAARDEAHRLVTQAKQDAARVLETERDELRREEEARLATSFAELFAREEKLRAGELERVLEVGALLAERLVRSTVESEPARMRAIAREVVMEARGARVLRFEIHPDDQAAIAAIFEELALPSGAISFEPNLELARGDVLLHTDLGTLDGRLRTQIERLRRALLE